MIHRKTPDDKLRETAKSLGLDADAVQRVGERMKDEESATGAPSTASRRRKIGGLVGVLSVGLGLGSAYSLSGTPHDAQRVEVETEAQRMETEREAKRIIEEADKRVESNQQAMMLDEENALNERDRRLYESYLKKIAEGQGMNLFNQQLIRPSDSKLFIMATVEFHKRQTHRRREASLAESPYKRRESLAAIDQINPIALQSVALRTSAPMDRFIDKSYPYSVFPLIGPTTIIHPAYFIGNALDAYFDKLSPKTLESILEFELTSVQRRKAEDALRTKRAESLDTGGRSARSRE